MEKETVKIHFRGRWQDFYDPLIQSKLKPIGHNGELQGLCPLHDDSNPSLSVNQKTGLWKCFGCNQGGDCFDFWAEVKGLSTVSDFPEILRGICEEFGLDGDKQIQAKSKLGKEVAHYDYTDEAGKLIYQVVKFEPKTFRQRRRDGRDDWTGNLKGVRRVLYNLPQVLKAGEVIICEGEKDCEALRALNLVATTNPGGSGKWRAEYSEALRGKDVVLCGDFDQPGKRHMREVGESITGIAASIKMLEIPDLGEKEDISDWIAQQVDRDTSIEKLAKMIENAEPWKGAQEDEALSFPDIMAGVAGDFAKLYSSYLEVPAHFLYMAFLTTLGAFLADRLTLASEIAPQPRLYTLLLGESADDRKSTAIYKTVEFFKSTLEGMETCWGVGSAEGLQKRMEGINAPLLLCLDEFKQFVSKCKIEASVLLPCVNTLFELNRYEAHTKTSSVVLKNAHLSLLAASTVQTYEHTWDGSFTDIGFTNRLFLVPGSGERKFSFPKKIPEIEKKALGTELQGIINHVHSRLELDIAPDAREKFHRWYIALEKSIHTKRLDVYALRLMSLLAINELKPEIDISTVDKVIALANWQLEVRRQHDPIDAENSIATMEEKIRRVLKAKGPRTDRELKQDTHASRSGTWIYATARNNLRKAQEIEWDKMQKRYALKV